MVTRARVVLALLLLPTLAVGWGSGTATAGQLIKPGQHYAGVVNGMRSHPVVQSVCAGPVTANRTGPVAAGQTASVALAGTKGQGYTGPFSQVYFWFVPPPGGPAPHSLTFTRYGSPQAIPSTIQVPCGGTGQVEFSSCPYLAPCAAGWLPEVLKVTFENIAV